MQLREFLPFAFILSVCAKLTTAGNVCTDSIGAVNGPVIFRHTWKVGLPRDDGVKSNYIYLSLCEPLSFPADSPESACNGTSMCRVTDRQAVVYSEFKPNGSNVEVSEGWTFLKGDPCKGVSGTNYKVSLRISCAPNLGAPEYFIDTGCQLFLLWRTSAACPARPARTEVPCIAYAGNGSRHDLSGLIKDVGGYNVETADPTTRLVINVCSDMQSGGDGIAYPPLSGACLMDETMKCQSVGQLKSGLRANGTQLYVEYDSVAGSQPREGCTEPPRTVILFRCPGRGSSRPPRLLSEINCHYFIEWETQHACSVDLLRSDAASCKFTRAAHGMDIDLSPLRKDDGYYTTTATVMKENVTFSYNVCGKGLGGSPVSCGKKKTARSAICAQVGTNFYSLGSLEDQTLELIDDVVTLKTRDGSDCTTTGSLWSSEIHFVCNQAQGVGQMQLVLMDPKTCTYTFIWETAYACPKSHTGSCVLEQDDVRIDLRPLTGSKDASPWTALGRLKSDNGGAILINICEDLGEMEEAKECGSGSAVCVKRSNGKTAIYGRQPSKLVYDKSTKTSSMSFEGGPCGNNKTSRSVIYFICMPGDVNRGPVLVREVESECLLELEWHTAYACPLKTVVGEDCKIHNDVLGFELDLNPLRTQQPYVVEHAGYRISLNVCGSLQRTPCNTGDANANVSVCQVSMTNGRFWSLGQVSTRLNYIDGLLNLTYVNGTPYNDAAKTPRSTVIAFICDYNAGVGKPEFLDEANRTYAFLWYTSYACAPSYFVGCVYRDPQTNVNYDLSRLNRANPTGDWIAEQEEVDYTVKLYVSVCRPLKQAPLGCSPRAAACIVHSDRNGTEKVVIANAGQARHAPRNIFGLLSLEYDLGDPCPWKNGTSYSTIIHFMCDPNQPERLHYMEGGRKCQHKLLWVTHMACPVSHLEAHDSCALTDGQGTTYSLASLHLRDSFYTVTEGDIVYELNVCGPVHGGHCSGQANTSVCMVRGSVAKPLAKSNGMSLVSDDPGSLRLTYVGNYSNHSAEAFKVVIEATCKEGALGHHVSLLRREPSMLVFELATPVVCEPKPAKCIFDDFFGYQFDLTPLQLRTGNWEVYHDNRTFHLSFCQSLNPSPSYVCPSGVAACETNTAHPSQVGISWGTPFGTPVVTKDGAMLVQYPNGAACANGQRSRKAVVSLLCDESQVGPNYVGESEDCEILFDFQTPAACPLKMATGSDCKVQDPRYGYVYDMSPLKNAPSDYEVQAVHFTYLINVCQPLNTKRAGCTGAAVCQTKPSEAQFSIDAGKPNSTLVYRNGLVTLTYAEGAGSCKGGFNRTTVITFLCDHSTMGAEGPGFLSESEDCIYSFEWRTLLACPPIVKSECTVSLGPAGLVDLSPLSNPHGNYEVRAPNGVKYVLNVCRSVVYSPGSACVKTAGACAVLKPHITHNIGQVQSPPVYEDGIVKIKYVSGDICQRKRSPRSPPVRMQTIIEFECDRNNRAGYPILLREEGCTYYFQWRTSYACPMAEDAVYDNCTVVHPITGEEFDLSVLRTASPVSVTYDKDTYSMRVCGPLPQDLCGPGSGMCLKEGASGRTVSLGKASGQVHFNDGVIFLEYADGDVCPGRPSLKRRSVIQFGCPSAGRSHLGPQLIHVDNDCVYYFAWQTERACRRVLHCIVEEGAEQYDLSPLIASKGRHTVLNLMDPGYTYYINVCQPVRAVAPYHMLANAGLVRFSKATGSVESLGEVFMEPFNDFEGHVTLLYVNGSQCAYNASVSNRARVIFVCDPSTTVEEPLLLDIDKESCLYIFEWRTNLVCPGIDRKAVPSRQCVFSIPQHGLSFDLSRLKNSGGSSVFEVSEKSGDGRFMLDVCGQAKPGASGCENSSVCLVSGSEHTSYGALSSFTYIQGTLKVQYANGSTCDDSKALTRSAEVTFECDENAGIGMPSLEHKHACHSTFIWKTSLLCVPDHRQCIITSGDDTYDFGLLASVSHVRNVSDPEGNTYWINVCSDMNADRVHTQSCPSSAAVCMRNKDHSGHDFTIGKAQSLKLSAVGPGRIDMTYGGGDPFACPNRSSQHPETLIQQECVPGGSSMGVLEFVRGPTLDECLFVFSWKSRTACPIVEDVIIPEKDGVIVEKRLQLAMNLSAILNSAFNVTEHRGKETYVYMMRLAGPVSTGVPGVCSQASVCQTKSGEGFFRDVGSYSTRKFVVRGSELLLEMESLGRKCGRTSKSVKSIISFECSKSAGLGSPEFLYESGKCHYLFRWATAHVCHDALVRIVGPDSGSLVSTSSMSSSAVVGIVTAAVIFFVIASAGLYLMRGKLRTLLDLTCYKSLGAIRVPQYHYSKTTSQLHSTDENGDTELLTSGSLSFNEDPSDPHVLT